MRIKTFLAKDMKAALNAVRAELGEQAVIVASQPAKDGGVIVRAAAETGPAQAPAIAETARLEAFEARYLDGLAARLRSNPADATARLGTRLPLDRAALLAALHAERTPGALASSLAEQAERSGLADPALALASALDIRMKIEPVDPARAGAILIAGPYGAGKTTVAAKLGAQARLAGHDVCFAATDPNGAGALARLQTFASHLDAALTVTEDGVALAAAITAAAENGAILIADTCGFDPRDHAASQGFRAFAEAGALEVLGVIPALADAEEAGEIAKALGELGAKRLVVTGLDCAMRRGTLIALSQSGLAIAQVSRSPFLADALEPLTPLALARDVVARAGVLSRAAAA